MVLLARSAGKLSHERLRTLRHPAQAPFHLATVGEGVQPLGAGAELTRRLRAAQQQHGEHGTLVGLEAEPFVESLVVLQRPTPGVGPHHPQQSPVLQGAGRALHGLLVEVDDGIAVAGLVAGLPQRVGRERVRRGHRRLLLQQTAQHALLVGLEDG